MTAAGPAPAYFDTAYIAKCYVNELDSPRVRALLARLGNALSCSLCVPEMAAVLARHRREGALDQKQAATLFGDFEKDVGAGVWILQPVSDDFMGRVGRRIAALPTVVPVRAGDAIHLCAAGEAGLAEIWTSDRHMLGAAPLFGLRGSSV